MALKPPELINYYAEIFESLGPIEVKRFFGGWGFRHMDTQFAVYLRDVLYLVVDDVLREKLKEIGAIAFSYEKTNKTIMVERFYSVPDDFLENPDALMPFVDEAFHIASRK